MKRDWKPGDVAMIEGEGSAWIGIVRVSSVAGRPLEFAYGNGGFDYVNDVAPGFTARPLVVIDPEDREQTDALTDAIVEAGTRGHTAFANRVQAALREFADPKPPKPEEPTGLGAVVEDADGVRHVRAYGGGGGRTAWLGHIKSDGGDRQRRWSDIDAVRVLSEGVQ